MAQANCLMYLSNAGVLLNLDNRKILIDALCKPNSIFKNPTDEITGKIINGQPPFDSIDLMLISHHHEDHFDAEGVSRFILNNKQATVISSAKVISLIKKGLAPGITGKLIGLESLRHSEERITVNGLDIIAVSLVHHGKMFGHVDNYAYLIDGSFKVFHTGDAVASKENYENLNLAKYNIDLLLAPFPYVGLISARQVIREYIKPRKIALLHMPYEERDSDGWIKATKKSYQSVAATFAEAVFLENIGSIMKLQTLT